MFTSRIAQVAGRFLTDYDAMELVADKGTIDIEWHQLVRSTRPIAEVKPGCISIRPMKAVQRSRLRPGKRTRVPRHPPAGLAGASASDAPPAAVEDASTSSEESDLAALEEEPTDEVENGELADLLAMAEGVDFANGLLEDAEGAAEAQQLGNATSPPQGGAEARGAEAAEAPPTAPPAPPAAVPPIHAARPRRGATVTLHMPGGSVSHYASKSAFEAVCDRPGHGRCVLTRTCKARGLTAEGWPKGGRPVGFLSAWLAAGEEAPTKEDHWREVCLQRSLQARQELRATIAGCGESGTLLLSCERPLAANEPPEPPTLEGYIV